jgi:sterol desaturase/sphingolipid hydroxylase (fatty acid hydroxylase superfamily)
MEHEGLIRLGCFFGVFATMTAWEILAPRRVLTTSKSARWLNNMGIVFINTVTLRLLLPIMAIHIAVTAQQNSWGLLNNFQLPHWFEVVVGVLILDLIIYLQHIMFHTVPFFWGLHMMHHADLDFDVTTGLRFHPIEIWMSMGIKISAVVVFGTSALSVLIFEIILNATAMFNHGNVKLPLNIDRILRFFVITPDMHRVHHSVTIRETNSNFGFNFPWWDRFLGTYRDQPAAGHEGMTIGLSQFRDEKRLTLPWMLALPFIGDPGSYSIARRGRAPVSEKK